MIKKNKKKVNKKIIIYIAMSLIILYVVYAVYLLIKQPTDKFTVEHGTLYMEETDVGYIIRNEQVIQGDNYKNGMEQIKNEGEKTAKGESIFRYYTKNEEELKSKIADLDAQIQQAIEGQSDLLPTDAKLLENQLDEKIELLSKVTDVSKVNEYKKQIDDLITKKSKIYGETSESGSYLKQLYNQRTELENQLNSGAEYITAPASGIVSYKVDGLEETLSPNNFSTLSKDFLESLNLKTAQLIATSAESGKIIDSSSCYIATISDSEEAKNAQLNDKVRVRLSNSKILDATICYISQENEDEMLIILEINQQISELANYRKISFDLIWWSSTGLKVPNTAIVEKDGLNYVVRNRAGILSKILVKVKKTNEKYSIVSNYSNEELQELGLTENKKITLYDEIIIHPDLERVE